MKRFYLERRRPCATLANLRTLDIFLSVNYHQHFPKMTLPPNQENTSATHIGPDYLASPHDENATSHPEAKMPRRTSSGPSNIESTSNILPAAFSSTPEPHFSSTPNTDLLIDIEEALGFKQNNDVEVNTIEDVTTGSAAPGFLNLPFDVLAEILIMTEYPGDVLAVARTSKQLCTQLVGPAAAFIWKSARIAVGLPDPAEYSARYHPIPTSDGPPKHVVGVARFMGREPAYAALVFDRGVCEVRWLKAGWNPGLPILFLFLLQACKKSTDRMYLSFSVKLRLCGNVSIPDYSLMGSQLTSHTAEMSQKKWSSYMSNFTCRHCHPKSSDSFSTSCPGWLPSLESSEIFGASNATRWCIT